MGRQVNASHSRVSCAAIPGYRPAFTGNGNRSGNIPLEATIESPLKSLSYQTVYSFISGPERGFSVHVAKRSKYLTAQ
jgi:hypothetical protein